MNKFNGKQRLPPRPNCLCIWRVWTEGILTQPTLLLYSFTFCHSMHIVQEHMNIVIANMGHGSYIVSYPDPFAILYRARRIGLGMRLAAIHKYTI